MYMLKLPENFESYEEAKREGFLKVMNLKEKGVPIVGIFCTYTPLDWILDK